MATSPMVAVSVWGGAHDGARFLVALRSVLERPELRYLGTTYTIRRQDPTGWNAVYTRGPRGSLNPVP